MGFSGEDVDGFCSAGTDEIVTERGYEVLVNNYRVFCPEEVSEVFVRAPDKVAQAAVFLDGWKDLL